MIAVFFTKTYVRIRNPSLAELDPTPQEHRRLQRPRPHWRGYERALEHRIKQAAIAARKMTAP